MYYALRRPSSNFWQSMQITTLSTSKINVLTLAPGLTTSGPRNPSRIHCFAFLILPFDSFLPTWTIFAWFRPHSTVDFISINQQNDNETVLHPTSLPSRGPHSRQNKQWLVSQWPSHSNERTRKGPVRPRKNQWQHIFPNKPCHREPFFSKQ